MSRWIARLSGRAPKTGSKPSLASWPRARLVTSSFMSIFASRSSSTRSWILAIDWMFFWSSAWKTTASSIRFRNSGRKCFLTSLQTAS
jgi:hypothetical protein